MSPGKEPIDITNMLLTQTSHVDYEELCRLDVLGLSDTPTNDQRNVYSEFREQLQQDEEGWYETGLPWRGSHPALPNNGEGSLRRLAIINRKLECQNLTNDYEGIIEEQKKAGVVERVWTKWESSLPQSFEVPRSLAVYREEIEQVELHSFGDVRKNGVAACVYAVVKQASGTNQGLVAARSRLSKQGLTIPRLELVAGHMAMNLATNVREAFEGLPLKSTHCWLDSSVALYWIRGQ